MALSNSARQQLIDATRIHRERLGLDPDTGAVLRAPSITRRSALAVTIAGIVSHITRKRGQA